MGFQEISYRWVDEEEGRLGVNLIDDSVLRVGQVQTPVLHLRGGNAVGYIERQRLIWGEPQASLQVQILQTNKAVHKVKTVSSVY